MDDKNEKEKNRIHVHGKQYYCKNSDINGSKNDIYMMLDLMDCTWQKFLVSPNEV